MSNASATARGLLFFRRFLRDPRAVGAICPSTRHLGAAMLRELALGPGDVIVEYGAGTGSLTQVIGPFAASVGARYLGIEREAHFCAVLAERFPQLDFAEAQVEDVRALLADRGLPAPRAIVSGLPLILLPAMREIVQTTEAVLQPGGEFRTFSYLQSYVTPAAGRLRQMMRELFPEFRIRGPVLRNFPPALVLCGHKAQQPQSAAACG